LLVAALAVSVAAAGVSTGQPLCGNGILDAHEQCDDGNTDAGDGCSPSCRVECQADGDCPSGLECAGAGACMQTCDTHCDCPQEQFCYKGTCLRDARQAVYCCAKSGCPPGAKCIQPDGSTTSRCPEDPNYHCDTPCDCGPAHCCSGNQCLHDTTDPWLPGTGEPSPCVRGVDATYCATDPACVTGYFAYGSAAGEFRCFDLATNATRDFCGGRTCYFAGDCSGYDVCGDTRALPGGPTAPGALSSPQGGACIGGWMAEAVYGWASDELLPPCTTATEPGTDCEAGWRPGEAYAVERIVGTVGSCGNGTCDFALGEATGNCPAD
jgi:cysteine-rich repeat protein